ncbi:MAG: hypothetical protein NWR09_02780, partial [Pseudomonadales bacterium]|nr:hypothetical protein [Pseudomonadales bacterium]
MIVQTTRRLLINLFEATLLGLLILAAAYVSIGRLLISQVDSYRPAIERLLTETLQVPVHIGALSGDWHYLDPQLNVDGFRIGYAAGDAAGDVAGDGDAAGIYFEHL